MLVQQINRGQIGQRRGSQRRAGRGYMGNLADTIRHRDTQMNGHCDPYYLELGIKN